MMRNCVRRLRAIATACLCWCCSFCVTDMGSPLDVYGGAPGAYQIPVTTFAVFPF